VQDRLLEQKLFHKLLKAGQMLLAGAIFCTAAQRLQAQEPEPKPPPQSPASTPATPTSPSQNPITNPQPVASEAPAMRTAWHRVSYTCDDNIRIQVSYRGTAARVSFDGHVHVMKQVMSADGGRYSDGKLVWWSKGNGGFLTDASDGGASGPPRLAENCKQIIAKSDTPALPPR
jgi:membrane-bound inhibitor of C-type lysozyme